MDGGAADERDLLVDLLLEPDVLEHRPHSPPRQEMASPPVPAELLVDIFLRLPDLADLVRASAACISFRRLVADRSFLRQYRKHHAPPLLGFVDSCKVFYPAMAPHPSATAANAVALAADFSFSFLPAPVNDWILRDIRDGRVLLELLHRRYILLPQIPCTGRVLLELLPFLLQPDGNPLHWRYILLPQIPDNLTATVEDPLWKTTHRYCETFLAPSGDEDEASFSVIWMAQCETNLAAFVFSSSTAQWRAISPQSWSDLLPGLVSWTALALFSWRQYAYGCFYWVTDWREKLLVLDTRRMEFSIAEPPPEAKGLNIIIVEAGEGRLGMFVRPQYANYLNYTIRRISCDGSSQWQFEKAIPLDSGYLLMDSAGRHLFLYQTGSPSHVPGCFLLDVKTFQLERVFVSDSCFPNLHAYNNFPPSLLSIPTVPSGVEDRAGKDMLERGCVASSSAQSARSE